MKIIVFEAEKASFLIMNESVEKWEFENPIVIYLFGKNIDLSRRIGRGALGDVKGLLLKLDKSRTVVLYPMIYDSLDLEYLDYVERLKNNILQLLHEMGFRSIALPLEEAKVSLFRGALPLGVIEV